MRVPRRDRRRPWRQAKRGQVILLLALSMSALISFGGLAVDMIFVYAVRVRLVTATDATALAVARALGRGTNVAEQESEVLRVSDLIFKSNFPSDLMLTAGTRSIADGPWIAGPNVVAGGIRVLDANVGQGLREVRLGTTVSVPTFFFRIFGVDTVPMRARAVAARRDVNMMVVMDRSASLHPNNADAWDEVKDGVKFFVDQFDNTTDRVGLVSFATNANVDVALDTGFKALAKTAVDAQIMPNSAWTNSAYGMFLGHAELLGLNDPDALNVIVFFTDGQPSAYSATFPTRTSRKYNYSYAPYCGTNSNSGVIGAYQSGSQFYNMAGPWTMTTSSPATQHSDSGSTTDHRMVPDCSADNYVNWTEVWASYGEWLLDDSGGCWPKDFNVTHTPAVAGRSAVTETIGYDTGPWGVSGDFCGQGMFETWSSWQNQRGETIWNAAKNGTLDVAQKARTSSADTVVYSVGLGGWGYEADTDFLQRVANDGDNAAFVSSENEGAYVYAPSKAQLRQSFALVANEIFRLIQ